MSTAAGKFAKTAAAIVAVAGFAFLTVSGYPTAALAKGHKGENTPSAESGKKPGETCEQYKKDSDDFKKCVEAQAKEYKKDKGKNH